MANSPTSFILVADQGGFVGAFESEAAASEALLPYAGFPFIYTVYPRADPDSKVLWILPYRGVDAVAFASDDRMAVETVQATLLRVGLTYDDRVDFWEQEFDTICPAALRRFDEALGVLDADDSERKQQKFDELASGKLATPEEPKRINLLESVVSRPFEPAPPSAKEGPSTPPAENEPSTPAAGNEPSSPPAENGPSTPAVENGPSPAVGAEAPDPDDAGDPILDNAEAAVLDDAEARSPVTEKGPPAPTISGDMP